MTRRGGRLMLSLVRFSLRRTVYPRARGWRLHVGRLGVEWWWFR
jgi:hypothetical protein